MSASFSKDPSFQKKTYKKLHHSPLKESIATDSILSSSLSSSSSSQKKIIPALAIKGFREEFKKHFLPLLIDIFELRQAIETHKKGEKESVPLGKLRKSPKEILHKLEQLQGEIQESQRWCEGILLQISKGIQEGKELLSLIDTPPPS